MLTNAIEVMRYVRASAGRAGLSVVFEDTNQPRHDGKTIYLPKITYKTTEDDLKQLMASTDHEVAHDRYSSFEVLHERDLDPQGILMFTWNFLEDSRINVIEAKEFRGFRENWDECAVPLVQKILERAKTEDSFVSRIMCALLKWESKISAPYFPLTESAISHYDTNEAIADVLSNFTDRLVACHNTLDKDAGTRATLKLAEDILKALEENCGEELKKLIKKGKKKKEKKKKGKDKDGKESSDSSTGDPSEGEAPEEAGTSEKETSKEDTGDEFKIVKVKLTEADFEKYSLSSPDEGKPMGKIGINWEPVSLGKADNWEMTDFNLFDVVNYPKRTGRPKYLHDSLLTAAFKHSYQLRVGGSLITQENFAQQVRRLIQIRARVQTQYGVKKGKLDQSRLSRISFKQPGFSDRVFKNRIENKTLDAAISILVDMSGSMNGDKAYFALASTLLMNEVCTTLGVPLEVVGFTDNYSEHPLMFVYKAFSDLRVSNTEIAEYFAMSSYFMLGNPDGENILWAYDRLLKRKEKKRLLIVMSDGEPCASKVGSGVETFTHRVIKEIEESKKTEIYGLGLCSNSVQYYYKHNSVVNKPQEIPSKLLELIERKLINVA
jgi:Cobalamin biosynthesis protein CobT VWA domain/Cobalamin biosynthesis protein CobT